MAEKEKDELEKMNEALSMSEQFVEKYQKPLLLGLLVVVVIVGAILGVRHFYLLPREDKAQAAMYQAVMYETLLKEAPQDAYLRYRLFLLQAKNGPDAARANYRILRQLPGH